jgi:hypothetical protein
VSRPPAWLVTAVLAVYPPRVRERYGEEIAGLLHRSERPWRDLANVTWNAALERIGSVRGAPLRPYVVRMGALLAAPLLFYPALLVALPVAAILSGLVGALVGQGAVSFGSDTGLQASSQDGPSIATAVVVLAVVATLCALTARQWTDALRVPALLLVVPTMLVLGACGTTMSVLAFNTLMNAPFVGGPNPEWVAIPVSAAVWWTVLTALLTVHRALTRHGRTTAARLVVAVAAALTLAVCTAINLLVAGTDAPVAMFLLPGFIPLATVCTPFAFALMRVAPHRAVTAEG